MLRLNDQGKRGLNLDQALTQCDYHQLPLSPRFRSLQLSFHLCLIGPAHGPSQLQWDGAPNRPVPKNHSSQTPISGQLSETRSPELMLIDQSARSANAKLRYFRMAFGAARKDMSVGKDELNRILKDMFEESKLNVSLHSSASSLPRPIVKLALLLILCAEKALPFGGNLEIALSSEAVSFKADSREVRADPELWDALATGILPDEIASDQVQFALTAHSLAEMNMRAMVEYSVSTISVGVT